MVNWQVVPSRLAPLAAEPQNVLATLEQRLQGMVYEFRQPDGFVANVSEARLVAIVPTHLRHQVQLVIGYSVTTGDLHDFPKGIKVVP